uniref:non-specific serine/threonine protein kinase n=1 Tax=Kalanchoe fedtschenkoi TaxID=63787 RepID=A0A7N0UC74_KALFE
MIKHLQKTPWLHLLLCLTLLSIFSPYSAQAACKSGCKLAYAAYHVWQGSNLTYISTIFSQPIPNILAHNPTVPSKDFLPLDSKLHVPFSCECLNGDFLGHTFVYTTQSDDTYHNVASLVFANLTTEDWIQRVNHYDPHVVPDGVPINVTVNCSCGDAEVSKDYGLFATYPLGPGENLSSVAADYGVNEALVRSFNPGFDGAGRIFVPAKGISDGVVAGISAAGIAGFISVAVCLYTGIYRQKKVAEASLLAEAPTDHLHPGQVSAKGSEPLAADVSSPGLTGITVNKSVEFSYEELAEATGDFSADNKIGQGGFGTVYYAELRGEKAAIKKMDMEASKEFLAELKVLTHVHHLNLVRLIGYCVEGSLFLVYEYMENGNLGQHLRSSGGLGKAPLSWTARVQIALDSARGLQYIHEHTVPVYIHRDIKSANILIDEKYHGKVADFGLTKLTEVGNASMQTRLVGTFGYMSPEYAQYGDVSPKIDVYAFGVVLYELISAKEAIVRTNEATLPETKGLVALFEDALSQADPKEDLTRLVDARLGSNYPVDSVCKVPKLARVTCSSSWLNSGVRDVNVADGAAGESVHAGEPAAEAEHEIDCSGADDTVVDHGGLGRWVLL